MQAFLSFPPVFPTSFSRTHVFKREGLCHSRPFYSIHCQTRSVVVSRTTDELRSTDDAKSTDASFSSPPKPLTSRHNSLPVPHDDEGSESAVDAALDDLSLDEDSSGFNEDVSSEKLPELIKPVSRPAPARPNSRFGDQTQNRYGRQGNNNSSPPKFEADPDASYYSRCGKCTAVYEINPEVLGRGRKVSCAVCSNVWFQKPDRLNILDKSKAKYIDYPISQKDELIANAEKERVTRSRGGDRKDYRSSDDRRGGDRNREKDPRGHRTPGRSRSQYSVFIGNLSYEVTEDDVKSVLPSQFQNANVSVVKDYETGRSKGFAFCDLSSESEVNEVVSALNGSELKGRQISARVGRKNTS